MDTSCPYSPPPLGPPLRGTRTWEYVKNFQRAKSEWLVPISAGPPGPGCSKIAADAVSQLRLALPSKQYRVR